MKKLFIIFAGLLLLSACGPTGPSDYLVGMMQYQGKSEAKVVDDLGPPDRTYEVDGTKYLSYTKASQQIYSSGVGVGGGYGIDPRSGVLLHQDFNDTATVATFRCDVFFAIRNKMVTKVGHRGNAC